LGARALEQRIQTRENASLGLGIAAGTALVGYTIWTVFFEE